MPGSIFLKYGLYKCDISIYRVCDDVSDRECEYESDSDWNGVHKHEVELTYCEPLNEYTPIKQYYYDENKNAQNINNANDPIVEFSNVVLKFDFTKTDCPLRQGWYIFQMILLKLKNLKNFSHLLDL